MKPPDQKSFTQKKTLSKVRKVHFIAFSGDLRVQVNRYSSRASGQRQNVKSARDGRTRWMRTTKVGCVTKQKTTYSTSSTDKQQSSHSDDDDREIAACFCVPSFFSVPRARSFRRGGKERESVPPYCFRGCFDFPSLLLLLSLLFPAHVCSPINKLSAR